MECAKAKVRLPNPRKLLPGPFRLSQRGRNGNRLLSPLWLGRTEMEKTEQRTGSGR